MIYGNYTVKVLLYRVGGLTVITLLNLGEAFSMLLIRLMSLTIHWTVGQL